MGNNTATEFLSQKQFVEQVVESCRGDRTRFCFILGAGASVESGIPTGTQLEMRWMDCLMGEAEDFPAPKKDPAETRKRAAQLYEKGSIKHPFETLEKAWRKAKQENGAIPSEYYFDIYSLRFSTEPRAGYWYLEKVMEGCRPSVGYHTLALLLTQSDRHNLVITTNFDSLVEDALFLYTSKKPMVAGHETLADYIDPNIRRPIVAKVHRSLFYDPINSADDSLAPQWEDALLNFFASYTPVVIGYGGGDKSLMSFLAAKSTRMRHGLYWCCRNGSDPGEKVKKLVREKNGHLVSVQGFDALMLDVGMALFREEILPDATRKQFNAQSEERMGRYLEQWDKWQKDNDATSPETVDTMQQAEAEDEKSREAQDGLNEWDYIRRANKLGDQGDYEATIALYQKALEKNPKLATAYNNLSWTYNMAGQYEKALESAEQAVALKPHMAVAYSNRACAYNGLGQYDEAVRDSTKAIELNPELPAAYNNRGDAYNSLGQYDMALADCTKAIELDPKYAAAYNNRGAAYNDLGQYDKAIADCTKVIELDPKIAAAYNNRARVYNGLGQYDKAIADCTKAIELAPNIANPHRHLGNAYAAQEDWDKALAALTEAIQLKEDYIDAYLDRAKVWRALGKESLAAADEAKAAALKT